MIKPITWVGVTHCARGVKNMCDVCVCVCVAKKVCLELLLDRVKSDELQTWWVDVYH